MDLAQRRSSTSSSPEFEFWPISANPAASPSCAEELFADGVLLPLPILPKLPTDLHPTPEPNPDASVDAAAAGTSLAASPAAAPSGSKRWADIFAEKPAAAADEKDKRKDASTRKPAAPASSVLNINIWPFSRSRSAGGGGGGSAKTKPPPRKASSAPCSRSNSRSEAAPPRRWAASPGRGGVPIGRSSPVWQIKRPAKPGPEQPPDKGARKDRATRSKKTGGGVRGINLRVNSCIGYRHQVSCRRVETGGVRTAGNGGGGLFGIKGFFSKRVH